MKYPTVERYTLLEFTGVPLAKLKRGIWYWPSYESARDFAAAFFLPTDRILPYTAGWAIQLKKSGPYVSAPEVYEVLKKRAQKVPTC